MTEKTLTVCPKELCPRKTWGKGKIKRAVTAGAGLIFKGSGFYITDYRSEGYKASRQEGLRIRLARFDRYGEKGNQEQRKQRGESQRLVSPCINFNRLQADLRSNLFYVQGAIDFADGLVNVLQFLAAAIDGNLVQQSTGPAQAFIGLELVGVGVILAM